MPERPGAETGRNGSEERRQRELCERNRRQRKRGGPRCAPPRPAREDGGKGRGTGQAISGPRVLPAPGELFSPEELPGRALPRGYRGRDPAPGAPRAPCGGASPAPQGHLPSGLICGPRSAAGSTGFCGASNFSTIPAVLLDPRCALQL